MPSKTFVSLENYFSLLQKINLGSLNASHKFEKHSSLKTVQISLYCLLEQNFKLSFAMILSIIYQIKEP